MSIRRKGFALHALSTAVFAATTTGLHAQETREDEAIGIEEVTVVGIRRALEKSVEDKKFAGNIMDTVNAEDIGKTTDQNIADALGRVTGVTIVSRDGEGSQVTVRGTSAEQNTISLNGMQLTSTDFSQAVDLSSFSADILSKLEVIKTPSADHDEGSLGANINLVTVKPLDLKKSTNSLTLQGRYNDFSDKSNYKLQMSGSQQLFGDTVGLAYTLYDETNSYRKDEWRTSRYDETQLLHTVSDQHGNTVNNVRAITPVDVNYLLHQNTSDRYGGSLGIQFAPSDTTEMMLNATYSKQTLERSYDGVKVRFGGDLNLIEGVDPAIFNRDPDHDFTDPQDEWYVMNTEDYTLTKRLDRFAVGDITRSTGGTENDNFSATFDFKHDFSGSFRMSAQLGVSDSQSNSLPGLYTNMQNWAQVDKTLLFDAGANIYPAGFDCTQSKHCEMVAGEALIDLGANITDAVADDGTVTKSWEDNTFVGGLPTGFNPQDAESFHLGSLTQADVTVEDTLYKAQVDFDFDLDALGITTVEFGLQASAREKFVDQQNYTFSSITKPDIILDPETGETLGRPAGPLTEIRAVHIADDNGFGVNDFMSSLGISAGNTTTNLSAINVWDAYDLVIDEESLVRNVNDIQTRGNNIDTQAAYLKANFSLFNDRLTGDVGVRYVRTQVKASGNSGLQSWDFPDNALEAEYDWLTLRDLRDTSLPACPQPTWLDPANRQPYEQKFNRIDGTGWDTSAGPDPSTWTRIPVFDPNGDGEQDPCHDPEYARWAELQLSGNPNNEPLPTINWQTMWRYADVQHSRNNGWDASLTSPNVVWDGEGTLSENYVILNEVDKTNSAFPVVATHEYSNVLPSLNLNYAITDDIIARFAASKTMTRPEIEDTRAGFIASEVWATYWGGGTRDDIGRGTVNLYNTQLDPLESTNLDLSFEWYFGNTDMLSVAFFSKDMKNFVDIDQADSYITDLRGIEDTFDVSSLLLSVDETAEDFGLSGCMPVRTTTDLGWQSGDPLAVTDDARDVCHIFNIRQNINGKKAKVEGFELGYSQVYDFLPGTLSNIGLSANYTYQESEFGTQISGINGQVLPAMPMANTPKHTYNSTLFWSKDGHQIRLSYRGQTDSLVGRDWNTGLRGRTWNDGSLWNDGTDTFDLSASYQINDNASVQLQAINLTDAEFRTYYTSRSLLVVPEASADGTSISYTALAEGNPLDGDAPTSRTVSRYKVGTTYRLGLRINF